MASKTSAKLKKWKRNLRPVEDPDASTEEGSDVDLSMTSLHPHVEEVRVVSTRYTALPSGGTASRSRVVNVPVQHNEPLFTNQEPAAYNNSDQSDAEGQIVSTPPDQSFVSDESDDESQATKRAPEVPIKEWLEQRERFLSEFLWMETVDSRSPKCAQCNVEKGTYRCFDCDGMDVLCRKCMLDGHTRNGLHRIEEWDTTQGFFKKSSLQRLGHVFQLNHPHGQSCPFPSLSHGQVFTVLDINGIHDVTLQFCGCRRQELPFIQLLRFGWFPATVKFPRTAFTLRFLKFFHILSFESKATGYEVFSTLRRITDNTGTVLVKDHYRTLLRVIREYRHIKMLKRAGRGHDPGGVAVTKAGQCAVLCPACPQPGKNLDPGWEDRAQGNKRFLYSLFLGIDANFCLKRKLISSNTADPSLSNGYAYFVSNKIYRNFIEKYGRIIVQEQSQCSNHSAVNRQRSMEGLAVSGMGACDCVRHEVKRAVSVGDLQKGERYVNMDYMFLSSLQNIKVNDIVVSYDIACQWSINLWDRMRQYPTWMHIDHEGPKFRFLVPKFHLPAHVQACRTSYSFNYNKYVGRTDGEGVERNWSATNAMASSTSLMGPNSRQDMIDDHFGDWNWKKTVGMGQYILRKLEEAVPKAYEHRILHADFTRGMDKTEPGTTEHWSKQQAEWEEDHSKSNPFTRTFKPLSLDAVRRRLVDEEAVIAASEHTYAIHESVSKSQLIMQGLELEILQQQLETDRNELGPHATDLQKSKWTSQSTNLRKRIHSWVDIQELYFPLLRVHRHVIAKESATSHVPTQSITLFLPSNIPPRVPCSHHFYQIEYELRFAQCCDTLNELRNALCMKAYVVIDKKRFQRGQHANTRSQGLLERMTKKINYARDKYRRSREALVTLGSKLERTDWETELQVLQDDDVRLLKDDEISREEMRKRKQPTNRKKMKGSERVQSGSDRRFDPQEIVSEGNRTVSWIWRQTGGGIEMDTDERLHESLRIEWCKSKARRDRWQEEVELLKEEKRRILAFLEYRAQEWESLASKTHTVCSANTVNVDVADSVSTTDWMLPGVPYDPVAVAGRHAFSRQQAHQFRAMRLYFSMLWQHIDKYISMDGQGIDIMPRNARRAILQYIADDENVPIPTPNNDVD